MIWCCTNNQCNGNPYSIMSSSLAPLTPQQHIPISTHKHTNAHNQIVDLFMQQSESVKWQTSNCFILSKSDQKLIYCHSVPFPSSPGASPRIPNLNNICISIHLLRKRIWLYNILVLKHVYGKIFTSQIDLEREIVCVCVCVCVREYSLFTLCREWGHKIFLRPFGD